MAEQVVLEAHHIIKRFPGVVALKGVTFDLRPGEVHALCGENGAGKSTLIKVLSGIHPYGSYEGDVLLSGEIAEMRTVKDAELLGIAVIYQELASVPEMTVAENIFLGREPTRLGIIDHLKMEDDARKLLRRFGIEIDPDLTMRDLGVGHQQLVEIVKALAKNGRVLILDEPTAALSESEVQILLQILRDLKKQGVSCIYISHKLDEVLAIADRITILRDGQSITTMGAAGARKSEIIRHMVGREIRDLFPRRQTKPGEPMLTVRNLSVQGPPGATGLRNISFEVRAGEVLGIGGLMGAGRSELLMHLFGAWGKRISGSVDLAGETLPTVTPDRAISDGIVLVSEDRKRYGLVLEKSVGFNLSLSSLDRMSRMGLIDPTDEHAENQKMVDSLRIKARDMEAMVGKLSGGNQQKVVLGKALMTRPRVVFLDEPTRGIDVGAKVEVYELVNRLTDAGQAVLLVSSELPELLGMSDRILMLHAGEVGGTFIRGEANQERLLAAAMGQGSQTSGSIEGKEHV
jgi:D-xylose transport system ATP-binding protein